MIARIMTDNQYRLSEDNAAELDKFDDPLHDAIQSGDEAAFAQALNTVIAFVRKNGVVVPTEEVVPSDVIIPAPDMTVAEAQKYLQREADATEAAETSPAETPAGKPTE